MPAKPTESAAPRHFWAGVVLVVLAVVAVTGWWSLRASPRTTALAPSPVADLEPLLAFAAPPADTARVPALSPRGTFVFRDPFVATPPLNVAVQTGHSVDPVQPEPDSLTLSAVLITQSRRAAVINDVLVDLGGRVAGGPRLTAVERDHVVLTDANGVRRTLSLSDGLH